MTRLAALIAATGLLAAACGTSSSRPGSLRANVQPRAGPPVTVHATHAGTPRHLPQAAASANEDVPSALDDPTAPGLPKPLINPDQIMAGGPPPDGIPPLTDAKYQRADTVGWLTANEPVVTVTLGGETRAYPVRILVWHEIVNDTVGGVPVAITYCPLCNSAIAFERRVAGRVVTFGTSGKLYHANLVMYDRQTESLWPQLSGYAVAGVLTGTRVTAYPAQMVAWDDWLRANPHAWVLSTDTGYIRDYGSNPYSGYDDPSGTPFLFAGTTDPRLPAMTRVVGLGTDRDPVAIPLDTLTGKRVLALQVAGTDLVVWALPDVRSPLDQPDLAAGREIAATGAFASTWQGRTLHFHAAGSGFVDAETGSRWNVLGTAISGPARGDHLAPVPHLDAFWFAWAAFQPETRVLR